MLSFFIRLAAGVCLFCAASAIPVLAQPAGPQAATAYHAGKVLDSVRLLEAAIPKETSAAGQWGLTSLLMDICASSLDFDCLKRTTPVLVKAAEGLKQPAITAPRITYVIALQAYMIGDMDFFRKTASLDFAVKMANPLQDPVLATRLFLLNAQVWQYQGQYDQARKDLDRAFASLLRIDGKDRFDLAVLLKQLIRANFDNHDVARALKWLAAAGPFLQSQLPQTGPDHADYLWLAAGAASEAGDFAGSAEGFDKALAAIGPLQLQPDIKEGFTSEMVTARAATAAIQGDFAAARKLFTNNPVRARREAIIAAGTFRTYVELYYAAAEIFFDVLAGSKPDPRWQPLFAKPVTLKLGSEATDLISAYRGVALALLRLSENPAEGRRLMDAAIAGRLAAFQKQRQDSTAFPLPDLLDRLLIGLGASYWTADGGEADLLVGGMELLNRNPRYAVSDVLASLAAQTDEEQRRAAHALLRLNDRHDAWQLVQLKEMLAQITAGKSWPGKSFAPQLAAISFDAATQRLARVVGPSQARLPTLKELQSGLAGSEAFMGFVSGRAICVRKNGLWTHALADPAQAGLDMKLLINALGDDSAPSDTRDIQYPAEAAVRLYHFLFDGFAPCLTDVGHIVFFASGNLASVPLAALLKDVPPRLGNGYDLSKGSWLIRDFAFSQVPSVTSFLSARSLTLRPAGDLLFAGVGDPRLKGKATGSSPDAPGLGDLEELPDTASELKAVAGLAGHDPHLLLGDEATEEKFRALPLSRFRLLHFATHGLVRGDIAGLGEAALVLTPGNAADSVNDGLLTASDVANLNLSARLVVLSACNTANVDVAAFNAQVQGLATAFAVAGAPATVASLWAVDSRSSAALMTAFYRHLMIGTSAAEALRQASLETLKAAPSRAYYHPRFWAPFIVLGDGGVHVGEPAARPDDVATVRVTPDGGEVVGAAMVNGLLVTSEIGPMTDGRHASLLVAHGSGGKTAWSVEDKEVGAGKVIAAGASLVVEGLGWNGSAVPELRAFSASGKSLWRKTLSSEFGSATIDGLAAVDGGFIAALQPFSPTQDGYSFYLVRFDATGAEKVRRRITRTMPGAAGRVKLVLLADGKSLYVAADYGLAGMTVQRNDFGFVTACPKGRGVHLYRLDVATLADDGFSESGGLRVDSLAAKGKTLFYGGARHMECDATSEKAELGIIAADLSLKPAWTDDTPFFGRVAGLHATPDGLFAAAEESEPLNVTSLPLDGRATVPAPSQTLMAKHPQFENDALREGVALIFDATGRLRGRRFLGDGLSQLVDGSIRAGNADLVYGASGFNPWIERLH